ncbi:MAG: hypothetical protein QOG83_2265 [Alphaproteobacteria bacterium]|nr:hypothetical protein [Alphaproteobacteria bacterium]
MHPRSSIGFVALAAAVVMSIAGAQAHDESKYPDWSSQWRRVPDGGPPRYDPSKPDGRGQQAPLTEEYRRIHEASMADQARGGQGLYLSSVKCVPMGMPFAMSIVFPFEFIITTKTTYMLFEPMTSQPRRIFTDGRGWPKNPDPTFGGYSIGTWVDEDGDGRYDVLEVETRHLRVPRLFDQTGILFHEDGQGIIKERIYLDKNDPKILYDDMTTIDNALTRPWSVKKKYARLSEVVWPENNCTEGNSDVVIGKEHFMLGGDDRLMPVTKNQPPPDLRHFDQIKK